MWSQAERRERASGALCKIVRKSASASELFALASLLAPVTIRERERRHMIAILGVAHRVPPRDASLFATERGVISRNCDL